MVIDFKAIRACGGKAMTHTAKHTPGPWTLERDRAKSLSIYAGSTFVGEVYNEVDEPSAQENANAHLIAAAPAMYEALKLAATMHPYNVTFQTALAQAEGRHQ